MSAFKSAQIAAMGQELQPSLGLWDFACPRDTPEVLGRAGRVIWGSWPLEAVVQLSRLCGLGHGVDET